MVPMCCSTNDPGAAVQRAGNAFDRHVGPGVLYGCFCGEHFSFACALQVDVNLLVEYAGHLILQGVPLRACVQPEIAYSARSKYSVHLYKRKI